MNHIDDRNLTPEERSEILKRKLEMSAQKQLKQTVSLSDLKKEAGIPESGVKK